MKSKRKIKRKRRVASPSKWVFSDADLAAFEKIYQKQKKSAKPVTPAWIEKVFSNKKIEKLWVDESEKRYTSFQSGKVKSVRSPIVKKRGNIPK